ncbi:MAG: hypothetical protein HYV63_02440 [Candidatus Schekmanbacteria bacterium]|nr:hypothetical protein [Candidatus Schekmanbacteria bacterium]
MDANAIKRAIVALRAICGATHAMIVAMVREVFSLGIAEDTVREVLQEAYQRAFNYRESVDLSGISRIGLDEMYRWDRCELTGVDTDSLLIFLVEKQPGCGAAQWQRVLERLRDQQGLCPEHAGFDGSSAIAKAVGEVNPTARGAHDINHLRRALEKVRAQVERRPIGPSRSSTGYGSAAAKHLRSQRLGGSWSGRSRPPRSVSERPSTAPTPSGKLWSVPMVRST